MIPITINKKLIFALGLVVIAIAAFSIWFFVFHDKNISVGPNGQQNKQNEQPAKPQVFIKLPEGPLDTDHDGISDVDEKKQGLSITEFDTDHDGLSDATELKIKTDPKNPDTDGDGYTDGVEVVTGHDPLKK